jgi:type VI secretion system protein ImpA
MALEDALLTPIDPAHPAGPSLRYTLLYDQIKQARREEDELPRGDWHKPRKVADLDQVIRLTRDALVNQSKDLQLAAWWTEAMLRRVGLPGLTDGLTLTAELLERFWGQVHPEIDDGDTDIRAAPLEWMDVKLADQVRRVPLTSARHDWYDYRESRSRTSAEAETMAEAERTTAEGATPRSFDASVQGTSDYFYEALTADLLAARAALARLTDVCASHAFSGPAPAFPELTAAVDSVTQVVAAISRSRQEGAAAASDVPRTGPVAAGIGEIRAYALGAQTADPTNPLAYLLLRALQWGTLTPDIVHGSGAEAPAAETRRRLTSLHREGRWQELLSACEVQMAEGPGRCWLDLQRYAVAACEALGSTHGAVREALVAEIGAVVSRFPSLPGATLSDGSAAADPATLEWLQRVGASPVTETDHSSPRGRFLARLQLAKACVGRGQTRVACAVTEELLLDIDRLQLDQWESPDLLLEPMLLLFESTSDRGRRRLLFNRICRLNPELAIARNLDPDA